MRAAYRTLFHAVTVCSLLLFTVTLMLWVRSYFVSDQVSRDATSGDGIWSWSFAHAGRGRLLLVRHSIGNGQAATAAQWDWKTAPPSANWPPIATGGGTTVIGWERFGISHQWRKDKYLNGLRDSCDWITLPLWFPALLMALLAAPGAVAFVKARRRRYRTRHGACAICGYDLRATPDRCPECGSVTANVRVSVRSRS